MMAAVKDAQLLHANMMQYLLGMEKNRICVVNGEISRAFSPSGQVVGRIEDISTCEELINRIIPEEDATFINITKQKPSSQNL
jgi:NAD(P)H-dependent flavin oxidoreductase YrpB (nitropropane dioxygenase family)